MIEAKVADIFKSIQGEAKYAGIQQTFVRFFGCNVYCSYCDTNLSKYRYLDVAELKKIVLSPRMRTGWIALTGGEPLCQADFLKSFLPRIEPSKQKIYLETNATLPEEFKKIVKWCDVIAFDIKLPSAVKNKTYWDQHQEFFSIGRKKEIFFKIVITRQTKPEEIKRVAQFMKNKKSHILYLQPESSSLKKKLISEALGFQNYLLRGGIDARILPQIHKFLKLK